MSENRHPLRNAVSNHSGDNIEGGVDFYEAVLRLNINDNQDRDAAAQSIPFPERPGEPDCLYFLRTGMCGYGSACRYNHPANVSLGIHYGEELPERVGQPDCEYFLKTGTCKYGSTCKYHHPRDRRGAAPVSFNSLGLPMRQEERSCPYYMRTGSCKFGVACKFHHPQIGASPVAGSPTSTILPTSGLPYVGGFSAWQLPRMSYLSGQGIQSYVPPFLSSPQGIIPAQNWNTYMGSMSGAITTGFVGSNFVYDTMNLGEPLLCGGQMISPVLPERPGQPECRYFMSTGTCKYGSDCKYHHPKERTAQSLMNPVGLPLRPGHAICSYYRLCGVCKFGPTCKFDHPILAIPQSYGLTSSHAFSVPDTSFINSSRVLSTVQPPNTSISNLSNGKVQHSDTKTTEDSSKQVDSTTPDSFPATSKS
ncbi:PREDICTED: zinc finger CCCH domain-containing protein 12-like isoform X1 [Lupinus angustifolius]|uniref:zinc finger CCCH domain-containing protein 12-like isoform X1 n=1 Tax=Lupinus angustifolius TaxID=3871 RepID=UPI00092E2B9E|nr:PREDICTED: zinc finger CCCH domain-containing protein 12-like isoform X1 [Lupinus angustifolius]